MIVLMELFASSFRGISFKMSSFASKTYKPEMVPTHNVPSLSVKRDMILLLAALASGSK